MSKPPRVAIYARVSTNDQDPDAQLLALRKYAGRRGFMMPKEYVDVVNGDFNKRKGKKDWKHLHFYRPNSESNRAFKPLQHLSR